MKKALPILLVAAVQLAILGAVPRNVLYARGFGTTIVLETSPRDPLDWLSGHYANLRYAVEDEIDALAAADTVYTDLEWLWAVLEPAAPGWRLVDLHVERLDAGDGRVAVRVRRQWQRHLWGASQIFVPEHEGPEVDRLAQAGGALVELDIAPNGYAAPRFLRIGERTFGE